MEYKDENQKNAVQALLRRLVKAEEEHTRELQRDPGLDFIPERTTEGFVVFVALWEYTQKHYPQILEEIRQGKLL